MDHDPAEPQIITVSQEGIEPFQAEPLQIRDYCNAPRILPDHMQETIPETSRFLDALEKTKVRLRANVNTELALELLFLTIREK